MMRSPLLNAGLFFLGTGVLILVFPDLLQMIVAFFLILIGLTLLSLHRGQKGSKTAYWGPFGRHK